MLSVQQSMRLLNKGERKYSEEEAQAILDLLRKLARIDYEDYQIEQAQVQGGASADSDNSNK